VWRKGFKIRMELNVNNKREDAEGSEWDEKIVRFLYSWRH
jgi:hypothetical protein